MSVRKWPWCNAFIVECHLNLELVPLKFKWHWCNGPLIWGPSSPGSQDRRHRVYRSIRSRQPGLDLGAFQSWQPEQHSNFPVSVSPVILFHQPYSSQSIVTCMPTSHMNCIWKHCLLLTENCTRRNFLQFCVTVLFILVSQPLLITSFRTNV